jgi:hypothetical protein
VGRKGIKLNVNNFPCYNQKHSNPDKFGGEDGWQWIISIYRRTREHPPGGA